VLQRFFFKKTARDLPYFLFDKRTIKNTHVTTSPLGPIRDESIQKNFKTERREKTKNTKEKNMLF
jgi:hypothetical protein